MKIVQNNYGYKMVTRINSTQVYAIEGSCYTPAALGLSVRQQSGIDFHSNLNFFSLQFEFEFLNFGLHLCYKSFIQRNSKKTMGGLLT